MAEFVDGEAGGGGRAAQYAEAEAARQRVQRLMSAALEGRLEALLTELRAEEAEAEAQAEAEAEAGEGGGAEAGEGGGAERRLAVLARQFRDAKRRTALHFAAAGGHADVMEFLLLGSAPSSAEDEGEGEEEQKGPEDSAVRELLEDVDEDGLTPLLHACQTGKAEAVAWLLARGARVNVRGPDGAAPVHHMAGHGQPEVLRRLCEAGADLSVQSTSGGTALHWAAGSGHVQCARCLLEYGIDVNVANKDGLPSVILAAATGADSLVAELVRHGADVGHILQDNLTVLHMCAEHGCLQAVRAILDTEQGRRCAKLRTNSMQFSPMELAACERHSEVVGALLPFSDRPTTAEGGHNSGSESGSGGGDGAAGEEAPELTGDSLQEAIDQIIQAAVARKAEAEANPQQLAGNSTTTSGGTAVGDHPEDEYQPPESFTTQPDAQAVSEALALKKEGNQRFALEDWEGAVDKYTQSLLRNGTDHTVWSNRSAALMRLKRNKEALADARVCRTLKPDWPKAYYREASALIAFARYEDAATVAFEGVKLDPQNDDLKRLVRSAVDKGREEFQTQQQHQQPRR